MGDPRELEWAKKPDALKESWTARIGTHVYTEFPLHKAKKKKFSVSSTLDSDEEQLAQEFDNGP